MKSVDNSANEAAIPSLPSFDLRAVISDFRRFSRFFTVIFVLVTLAIFIPILMQTPTYTSHSNVMIDPRTMNTSPVEDVLSGLPADAATIDTEVEIISSRALAGRVVTSLKLTEDAEFNPDVREKKGLFGGAKTDKSKALTPLQTQYRDQAIIDRVLAGLKVSRQGMTRIITISYTSQSAEKSTQIANEWARLYLTQQIEAKFEATKEANSWLNDQLDELRVEVLEKEAAVQNYMIVNNLMSAQGATLTEQEISNLNQTHATVKVDLAEAEARLATARRQLAAGSTGEDVGEALDSQVIKDLRQQRTQVTRRIAEMESRYGPLHPEIIKAKRELQDIDAQIKSEIQRIISNLEAQASVQRQRSASVAGSVGQARGKLVGNNRAMVRLNELQREAEASRTLYESYLDRFKQTAASGGIEKTDARIVSHASLPTGPSAPKLKLSFILALMCGLGAAVAAVLVRRALDSGLVTGTDVETLLDQSYLAGIPALASTAEAGTKITTPPLEFIQQRPLSVFAEGFRSLRASLLYSRLGESVKVIAVTSSLPGEGKTTTSVCLAQVMVQAGQSVVVVDCDLRRRSVKDVLGFEVKSGLLEVLAGTATLDEVIIKDAHGVQYVPLADNTYTPKEVFGSDAMDRLLTELRERFDTVILDTAPVLPVVDTRILARKADATIMLLRWRKTPRNAVTGALSLLETAGAKVTGVVLTQVDMKEQARYGYGDSGYYYNAYKKYYTE